MQYPDKYAHTHTRTHTHTHTHTSFSAAAAIDDDDGGGRRGICWKKQRARAVPRAGDSSRPFLTAQAA